MTYVWVNASEVTTIVITFKCFNRDFLFFPLSSCHYFPSSINFTSQIIPIIRLSLTRSVASQQLQDHRYVLTDDFVLMIVFGELWAATPAKLPGRELSTAPQQQTTSQLTPPAGEAGQQARQKTSNVPFMGLKKTTWPVYHSAARLVVLFLPSHRFLLGIKGRRGRGEGQQHHKQKESCLRWKQRCEGRGPFI